MCLQQPTATEFNNAIIASITEWFDANPSENRDEIVEIENAGDPPVAFTRLDAMVYIQFMTATQPGGSFGFTTNEQAHAWLQE